jgi:FtsH-binding integral membrane protein
VEALGTALLVIGLVVTVIGSIWFLITAFQESILWGLAIMFIPFVGLLFLAARFEVAAKPFGISLLGSLMMLAGFFMMGGFG